MSRYRLFDISQVELWPVARRGHDLVVESCLPLAAPNVRFVHPEFELLLRDIRAARERQRPVVMMIGGHPIKLGLSRYLVDLIERRWITHLAMNGAAIIHDFELALFGGTSEDVAKWIQYGQFGLWQETGRLNDVIRNSAARGEGLGEGVGRVIEEESFANSALSVAAAGWRCQVPVTVHVSVGSDIIHAHANCDGSATGQASYTDFLIFADSVSRLEGGVFLNVGSAVTGPEVYLKALSMARNVSRQSAIRLLPSNEQKPDCTPRAINGDLSTDQVEPRHFTTAVFDLVPLPTDWRDGTASREHAGYYYRPWKTILIRTIADGGRSFYFQGNHRLTIPSLWHGLTAGSNS